VIAHVQRLLATLRATEERGQASVEYALVSVMILGGTGLSWPFLVKLLQAMNTYYASIFAAIQCPLP